MRIALTLVPSASSSSCPGFRGASTMMLCAVSGQTMRYALLPSDPQSVQKTRTFSFVDQWHLAPLLDPSEEIRVQGCVVRAGGARHEVFELLKVAGAVIHRRTPRHGAVPADDDIEQCVETLHLRVEFF